jgi:hypothetical protein
MNVKLLLTSTQNIPQTTINHNKTTKKPAKEIVESSKEICRHYDIPYLELKDIDKKCDHPTAKGMRAISQQVLQLFVK